MKKIAILAVIAAFMIGCAPRHPHHEAGHGGCGGGCMQKGPGGAGGPQGPAPRPMHLS